LGSDSKIALSINDGIVCLKYPAFGHAQRHYFFGKKQDSEQVFLYVFVPEISHSIRHELKETFSGELEFMLNSDLNGSSHFEQFFTLPVQVSHDSIDFDGKKYNGVAVDTRVKPSEIDSAALDCWRKKVFVPFCRFLDDGFMDYFVQKAG